MIDYIIELKTGTRLGVVLNDHESVSKMFVAQTHPEQFYIDTAGFALKYTEIAAVYPKSALIQEEAHGKPGV